MCWPEAEGRFVSVFMFALDVHEKTPSMITFAVWSEKAGSHPQGEDPGGAADDRRQTQRTGETRSGAGEEAAPQRGG